ncbi:MAG: RsmB/NOP family class I SAM-dependent RNA methyltransferase, partial [Halobacteriota archaeon]
MDPLERYRPIIDDFEAFRAACDRPLPRTVRVHTSSVGVDRVIESFDEAGVQARQLDWSDTILEVATDTPGRSMPSFLGWVQSLDAASCLPAPLLEVAPGDRVWDTCAAPGGKTNHIADLLGDRGLVYATDDNLGRLASLRFNTERLGVTCVAVERTDARHASTDGIGIDRFDAALVDAPCSCEGTVRKAPHVLEDWDLDHIDALSNVQRGILSRAIELTKPGGRVVYATCTFAPEENEAVVDAVLEGYDIDVEAVELPIETSPGITEWNGRTYDPRLSRARRIYPHPSDTGGFFIAALRVAA